MQPECLVMAVAFVERLLRAGPVGLSAFTWRRVLLAALVVSDVAFFLSLFLVLSPDARSQVADKCFEDYAVWNADFVSMFRRSDIQDLNSLERSFLTTIEFATTFHASDYARYYFALRELSDAKDALPQKPLTDASQRKLETNSRKFQLSSAAVQPAARKDGAAGAFFRSVSLHHFQPDGSGAQPSESSDN